MHTLHVWLAHAHLVWLIGSERLYARSKQFHPFETEAHNGGTAIQVNAERLFLKLKRFIKYGNR